MKTLQQSLIDYEPGLLKAIAEHRAVPLSSNEKGEIINQLVDALLSPVATAIMLDDLSKAETEALQFLLASYGQAEGARFSRQFGAIRTMGSVRLARERPWQNPANPAEGLWYRGLIFKTFQVSSEGGIEMVYIPSDVLALMPADIAPPKAPATIKVAQTPTPGHISHARGHLRENIFSLLVYLQTHPVRVQDNRLVLNSNERQALKQCLLPPPISSILLDTDLDFHLHLALRAKLLTIAHGRLRPERETARSWLQGDTASQLFQLQNSWRADPSWNDLWHVPGIVPQATGWENSPLRARSKILGYLEDLPALQEDWISISSFVAMVKQVDPDFQRPDGNYESWYLQDTHGNSLMGFDHWEQVEGGLINFIISQVLLLLGVTEVGAPTEESPPTSFRLTTLGRAFLVGRPATIETSQKVAYLRIDNNFNVRVSARISLYDRFQLARFAQLTQRDEGWATYQIARDSIRRALKNGVTPDQIMAFLNRSTNNQIPLKIVETLRAWGTRYATAKIEQAMLLTLEDKQQVAELRQHPALGPLLGESINPTVILIPAENVAQVRHLLTEMGYLDS